MNARTPQSPEIDLAGADYPTSTRVSVERWRDGQRETVDDVVAEEVPIALEYNGISHAVMMATPADLEDFALGFSLTEGIVADPGELYECEIVPGCEGVQVQMRIATERFVALKEKRRNLTGRTGCGLCGAETLAQAVRHPQAVAADGARFTIDQIHAALQQMQGAQQLQQVTGATHAAAWLGDDGRIALVREDVGRHNALDKLIGALAEQGADFGCGAAIITSRASYEMVQKAATVGIGFIAAISAPTALAIRLAEETDVTLLGFVRKQGHVVVRPAASSDLNRHEESVVNAANLIKMANQIGSFFSTMPDHEQAVADLAAHLKRFWEPRMRRALLAHIDQTQGAGLSPIVMEAVQRHGGLLQA